MPGYDPERLNKFPQLTETQSKQLQEASLRYPLESFLMNYRNVEEIGIDFVYSSAKLEGNTYSKVDTINLLKMGITAGGKLYSDAQMILNLRDAYNFVLTSKDKAIDRYFIMDVHSILAKDLLPAANCEAPREDLVRISGTDYSPPVGRDYLNEELKYLLEVAGTIKNPFERAIYLKLNLCYLQYFQDINKRTARMVQTFSLLGNGEMPLLAGYVKSSGYIEAILEYYNTGSYVPYLSWFVSSYRQMVKSLTDSPAITKSRSVDLRNNNN